jgi:hypothetical protein
MNADYILTKVVNLSFDKQQLKIPFWEISREGETIEI